MDKENSKNNDNDEIIFEEIIAGKSKSSKKDDIIFEEAVAGKSNLPEDKNILYKNVITDREIFPNNKLPTQSNRVYPPMDYDTLNQQRILENFYSNIQLSNEDKKVLYPKIMDHLDKLWREGGNSVEYVQRHACEDSEIDNIMKTSWIVITEEKRRQIVKRVELIFLAKYRFEYFCKNLVSLKESSPERFEKIVKDILEIEVELKNATGKELYQLHSDFERDKKRIEQEQLNKVQNVEIKKDIFIVKEDIDLIGDKDREEIRFRAEKLFNSGLPRKSDYILYYFGEEIKLLDDNEIIKLAEDYENKFDAICVDFAEKLKDLIINEYGGKILNMNEFPLSSIFSFDLGRSIRSVKTRKHVVLSIETLNQIKNEINNYRFSQNIDLQKYYEQNYKKIFDFIDEHIEFSKFIKQKASGIKIVDPRLVDGTNNLEVRSWLIENLRFIFPKKFELPLDNNLLSWFVFGDFPEQGETSKINNRLRKREIGRRFYVTDLLGIDYRVFNLTINDFKEKKLDISQKDLDNLRKKVSYLIYNYIFFRNHDIDTSYVSNTTRYGINVGIEFWMPEYFLIRVIFFVAAESNQGVIKSLNEIGIDLNLRDIQKYLTEGYGFGDSLPHIVSYIENLYVRRPLNSNIDVFKMAFVCLEEYNMIYFLRAKNYKNLFSPFDSQFEKDVNDFLLNLSPLFLHHKTVVEAIGKRMISLNIDGNKTIKRIHYALHYDFYLKLDDKFRKCLGLDDQWKAIAIEANGTYWHSEDREQDLLKKAIAKAENIILVEIWDNMDVSVWLEEIVLQINEQARSNLIEDNLLHLNNCYKIQSIKQ